MNEISKARAIFGGVCLTVLADGRTIPWKPLSIQDFIRYNRDFARGLITEAQLENEVFCKCVVDTHTVRNIDNLPAGDVTTVVANILQFSGPRDVDTFNEDLEASRNLLYNDGVKAIHDVASLISLAFPYKPEEIYAMDYETFLTRAIQAEEKLLQMGVIAEPLRIEKVTSPDQPKPKIDAKSLWEAQQYANHKMPSLYEQEQRQTTKKKKPVLPGQPDKNIKVRKNPAFTQISREKWWKDSPILEQKPTHGIDFNTEFQELALLGSSGHEKLDMHLARNQLAKDAQVIYKDVLEALAKKKSAGGEK